MHNRTLLLVLSTLLAGCTLYSGQEATPDADSGPECSVPPDATSVPPDATSVFLCAEACIHNFRYTWTCSTNGFCLCDEPQPIVCRGLCSNLCSDQWVCDSDGFCSCNNGAMVCREAS